MSTLDIKQLDLMILRQRRQCAGIYNPYMHGLLNGMLYVRSLLIEDSPTLVTKSELLAEDIQPHYNCVGVDYWGENRLLDEEDGE